MNILNGLAPLVLLASGTVTNPMTESPHDEPGVLTLDVQQRDGAIEVQLSGHSPRDQQVSYTLEVTGNSSSRHRGKTTLAAGRTVVLSTMRATSGADWCVKLVAEEPGRAPYEVIKGSCSVG